MIIPTISKPLSYALSSPLTGNGVSGGGVSLDAAVTDWVSRVVTNGGTVSTATQTAANNFVTSAKSNGYWDDLNRVNLFAGSNLDACLTPLLIGDGGATDTNTNFVSGDYSESTGLQGDGSTKHLDTGLTPAELGKDSNFMVAYARLEGAVNKAYFGAGIGEDDAWHYGSRTGGDSFARNSSSGFGTSAGGIGIRGMRRSSSTGFDLLVNDGINSVVIASHTTASSASIFIFARNDGGTASINSDATLAGYVAGAYLDNTKYAALRTDWEAFQDALSRGVLA